VENGRPVLGGPTKKFLVHPNYNYIQQAISILNNSLPTTDLPNVNTTADKMVTTPANLPSKTKQLRN
jgi:hypothetical protein